MAKEQPSLLRAASRLKTLELQGYKTFASRTTFEFPGKITAIVGPNGSGKSNIADAIRWVLGEQSYSLLRGRKTEDMIFAGSELRQRASMASAMITFENEDGWLPIDYSEVSIARRAYRDGQNEYLLNGQRVRLKETSEILAQSGLAERTYTIIGQGLVDAALSLRPEERRRFFEEAAGIGLYRSRREEALGRLETTRRNLERVQDILSELEPRLKSLEKQAARAIEYERIRADLRLLLRDWYGYHWQRTQVEMGRAREALLTQENRLRQIRQRGVEVEKQVQSARSQLQQLRGVLNDWHAQTAELHRQREEVNRNLAVLDERRRAMIEQQGAFHSDLARLEEEEKIQQQRQESIQAEVDALVETHQEASTQAQAAVKLLEEKQNERTKIENALRELRRQSTRLETRQVEQRAHLKEITSRVTMLQDESNRLKNSLPALAIQVEQAESSLKSAQAQLLQQQAARQKSEESLQEIRQTMTGLEDQRKKLRDKIAGLQVERSRTRAQMDVLEQAEKSLSGVSQGVKAVLTAASRGNLKAGVKPISHLLEVPVELESAIAAALGESLDGLTVDAKADPEEVLSLLEQSENGRALLFPLAWLRTLPEFIAPQDEGVVGIAARQVKASSGLQPLIELLLGQVLIVKDRKTARRMAQELPPQIRTVTLKGEVFFGYGAVSGGKENRASLIARPRQMRELTENSTGIEQALADADRQSAALQEQISSLEARRKELEKQLGEAGEAEKTATRAVQRTTLELEQSRQKLAWQQGQLDRLSGQIDSSDTEIKKTEADILAFASQQESFDLQINEMQHSLSRLVLDDIQSQVVHWKTQVALSERSLLEARQRRSEYQQSLDKSRQQQKTYQDRLLQVESQLDHLEKEKTSQRERAAGINAGIEEYKAKIDPAETRLDDLEVHYERLQMDLTAAQQQTAVSERHATQAQLEFGRLRESLESLRRRIEEDFGLVAFEYQSDIAGPNPLPLDGMVEQLPAVVQISADLEENINRQRSQLRRMGAVNPEAQSEYYSVKERFEFLTSQVVDLRKADQDLREIIAELDGLMKKEFRKTFDAVAIEFKENFTRLFGGGSARLVLNDEENPTEGGIDIEARLPGRREQGLSLLSGGERSLTAVALIFSLLKVSPTPFCVLDEVDAMLDEANVGRFCELLNELSQKTQFIVITHNRNTVQVADVIYGVTMGKDTASQVISLRLDEVSEEMTR
ncbi:MAG: chromosome segregation protein SMC [Chloroflexota bacterium]|jgi:chromosome segregation protein